MQTAIGHTSQYLGGGAANLRDSVIDYLGEYAYEYDVSTLTADYRVALNDALISQVGSQLCIVGEDIMQSVRSQPGELINGTEPEYYVRAAFEAVSGRVLDDIVAHRQIAE